MATIPDSLTKPLSDALVSCEMLFLEQETPPFPANELYSLLRSVRLALRSDVKASILRESPDSPDCVSLLNNLARRIPEGRTFAMLFDRMLLDILSKKFPNVSPGMFHQADSDAAFYFSHAKQLACSMKSFVPEFLAFLRAGEVTDGLLRIIPSAERITTASSMFLRLNEGALGLELRKRTGERELFSSGRVFRHKDGVFCPQELETIRAVDEFYGYQDARRTFMEHFKLFSEGKSNLPLLISSLPGLGKTQMTISHTLHFQNLTLILPDAPDISSGLESLLRSLEPYPHKKFVLFFDDIDASAADWYYFRANIGGAFNLPLNIAIVISSNQRFPANISSRGRGFVFPIFDEVRCQEMVADFLISKGMKDPAPELVAVIASDYVEEFGQKMFEELSPRTLVRYLQEYNSDPKKRRKMLETSKNELITEPDAQVFYEENVKLMRSLYGDSVLDELRQKEYNG